MRYTIITVLSVFVLMTSGLENYIYAKEWSDEIRMTHAEENQLYGMKLDAVIDSRNDIHVFYSYQNYQDEDYGRLQPVYQKFNRSGEPITEPLVIGTITDIPDSINRPKGYTMFCHSNDNIYLLWGGSFDNTEDAHITVLDGEGEVIDNDIILRGVRPFALGEALPRIVVDSNDNIIMMSAQWRDDHTDVFYARFNPEGELIDSVHILSPRTTIITDVEIEIGQGDTLHTAWKINGANRNYTVHYSKISPDDEYIIDNYTLPNLNGHSRLHFSDLKLDTSDRAVFSLDDGYNGNYYNHIVRYDRDMNSEIQTYIGQSDGEGNIFTDSDNNIHVLDDFHRNELDNGRLFLGYCEVNSEGEIIDSLQLIHDNSMNEGGIFRADWLSENRLFAFQNGQVCIIWTDRRHWNGENDGIIGELYMRYSIPDNGYIRNVENQEITNFTLLSNYPNPFNNQITISYQLPLSGQAQLSIYDIQGRLVEQLVDSHTTVGDYKTIWQSQTSGIYFVLLKTETGSVMKKVVCIK